MSSGRRRRRRRRRRDGKKLLTAFHIGGVQEVFRGISELRLESAMIF